MDKAAAAGHALAAGDHINDLCGLTHLSVGLAGTIASMMVVGN
jgi:hypothetical protein